MPKLTETKKNQNGLLGLFSENPVLERGLVLAPVIVASYNCENSLILGLAFLLITLPTVLLSSLLPKKIPYTLRIILYALIGCAVFVPTAILLNRLYPNTIFKIGVYLPLLVVNSLIVVKSESRFHKKNYGGMFFDLLGHCVGFFWVILLVGFLRELLGSGAVFGHIVMTHLTVPAVLMPFSGFILVGFLAAGLRKILLFSSDKKENANKAGRNGGILK